MKAKVPPLDDVPVQEDPAPLRMVKPIKVPKEVTDPLTPEAVVLEMLKAPKGKRAVPTLVTYYDAKANAYRHVILDFSDVLLEQAWVVLREAGYTQEEFLAYIYDITRTEIPRMYRAVAPLTLR